MTVLNEPNECYTFSGMTGQSDITLVSGDVRCDWGISDYNVILIRMMYGEDDEREEYNGKKWVCKTVHWEEYKNDLTAAPANENMQKGKFQKEAKLSHKTGNRNSEIVNWVLVLYQASERLC